MSLGTTHHLIIAWLRGSSESYTDIAAGLYISLLPEYIFLILVSKGITGARAKFHDDEIVHDRPIIDDVQRNFLPGRDGKRIRREGKISRRHIDRTGWPACAAGSKQERQY